MEETQQEFDKRLAASVLWKELQKEREREVQNSLFAHFLNIEHYSITFKVQDWMTYNIADGFISPVGSFISNRHMKFLVSHDWLQKVEDKLIAEGFLIEQR